jgi:hypothetical protein
MVPRLSAILRAVLCGTALHSVINLYLFRHLTELPQQQQRRRRRRVNFGHLKHQNASSITSRPPPPLHQIFRELLTSDTDTLLATTQTKRWTPSLQYLIDHVLLQSNRNPSDDDDDDDNHSVFDSQLEAERCRRYRFRYNPRRKTTTRRRIFWGSLIADDSWHTILMAAVEGYGMFHTVALVESNTTQTLTPRPWRFSSHSSLEWEAITHPQLWGPATRVSVDPYIHNETTILKNFNDTSHGKPLWLHRENMQRDWIIKRWKANGMTAQDIGYLSDIDEIVSRDFLLALQTCEVKPFLQDVQSNQYCLQPMVTAPAMVLEGSPMCIEKGRRWHHPNLIIGECIEGIGNSSMHPTVQREPRYGAMMRVKDWERRVQVAEKHDLRYPLWSATDMRMEDGVWPAKDTFPVAFHFHNFFDSIDTIRTKYSTYGHPVEDAGTLELQNISMDLDFMVDCLLDDPGTGNRWQRDLVNWTADQSSRHTTPRAFRLAPEYPLLRHQEMQQMARDVVRRSIS